MFKIVNGIEVPLSEEEILEFNQREQAHLEGLKALELVAYRELRRAEYPKIEDLVVAITDSLAGNGEDLNQLLQRREAVRLKYPKPV